MAAPDNELRPDPARLAFEIRQLTIRLEALERAAFGSVTPQPNLEDLARPELLSGLLDKNNIC